MNEEHRQVVLLTAFAGGIGAVSSYYILNGNVAYPVLVGLFCAAVVGCINGWEMLRQRSRPHLVEQESGVSRIAASTPNLDKETPNVDRLERLETLVALLDKEIITEEEFDETKKRILGL